MAKARFTIPAEERPRPPGEAEDLMGPPPVVPPCRYLREKATGMVHVYSDWMAQRGDLVEACDDPQAAPPPPPPPRPKAAAPPPPPVPRRAVTSTTGIPHSSVALNLDAHEPGPR